MINSAIFPAPDPPTYGVGSHPRELVCIPKPDNPLGDTYGLLLEAPSPSTGIILYAHPNAVDISQMYDELNRFRTLLNLHILAFEFSGYGLTKGEPAEDTINEDAQCALKFITDTLQFSVDHVLLFGRSIGCGPMVQLAKGLCAAGTPPAALIMECPFTSIKDAVRSMVKKVTNTFASAASSIVADRFNNLEHIVGVTTCPILMVHGVDDTLVPAYHSQKLYDTVKAVNPNVQLQMLNGVGHNDVPISAVATHITTLVHRYMVPKGFRPRPTNCPRHYFLGATIVPSRPRGTFAVDPTLFSLVPGTALEDVSDKVLSELLRSREGLCRLLTLNTILFARCVELVWKRKMHAWELEFVQAMQRYEGDEIERAKNPSAAAAPRKPPPVLKQRFTLEQIIEQCLLAWGSPLSAHLVQRDGVVGYEAGGVTNVGKRKGLVYLHILRELERQDAEALKQPVTSTAPITPLASPATEAISPPEFEDGTATPPPLPKRKSKPFAVLIAWDKMPSKLVRIVTKIVELGHLTMAGVDSVQLAALQYCIRTVDSFFERIGQCVEDPRKAALDGSPSAELVEILNHDVLPDPCDDDLTVADLRTMMRSFATAADVPWDVMYHRAKALATAFAELDDPNGERWALLHNFFGHYLHSWKEHPTFCGIVRTPRHASPVRQRKTDASEGDCCIS